jgi:hypothetical protein
MASRILRINRALLSARPTLKTPSTRPLVQHNSKTNDLSNHFTRPFSITAAMAAKVDATFISQITAAEKLMTGSDEPVKGGPTAKAQQHVGQNLTSQVIHDITEGEKLITGTDEPFKGGPTSVAQSTLSGSNSSSNMGANTSSASGTLDSATLHKITEAEKNLTGQARPIKGGPTAQAQSHAKEPITSEVLHDITEGEKKITGGERVKGGPTSQAQSELGKSRS